MRLPHSQERVKGLSRAEMAIDRLERRAVGSVTDVLMVEAGAAAGYFTAWRGLPLLWARRSQKFVPPAWMAAEGRRSMRDSANLTNRHATHPVNAMLNYGYAVLHSQVQLEAVTEGYDPRLGIMHESRSDSAALVLDLMELRRPMVDAAVLKFIAAERFAAADFVVRTDGVCRLAPQLARRLCGAVGL